MNVIGQRTTASLLAAAGLIATSQLVSQSPAAIRAAGQVFQNRCARCHVIPDQKHGTDRAWLDQVNRTA